MQQAVDVAVKVGVQMAQEADADKERAAAITIDFKYPNRILALRLNMTKKIFPVTSRRTC